MAILDKIQKKGPRKLLSLDGGGIRGIVTLEALLELERQLHQATRSDKEFVLADYFDYIAGTSTGAIIAVCLSLGMKVAAVKKFYLECGPAMFDKAALWQRFLKYRYSDTHLADELKKVIHEQSKEDLTTLGSSSLRTFLLLVLRNATTDSPWPLTNNPEAKYNDITRHNCNLHLPLWQLVRASAAAPTYFPPEVAKVGDTEFVFVDGGGTMYNNPAFQLFLMATLPVYKLEWKTGTDKMLLVSIGTGGADDANLNLRPDQMNKLYNAHSFPSALMRAASVEQDMLCRIFGDCRHGGEIDREVFDLRGALASGPLGNKLFSYVRYNADLSSQGLKEAGLGHIDSKKVQELDSVDQIPQLLEVGQSVAQQVSLAHFAGFY
jgi:patatin-like phospholipase/acyl hydrolase